MTWAHAHRQNLVCKCQCAPCVCPRRSDQCSFNSMFSFLNMCLLFVVAVVVISGQTLCFTRRGYLTVISFCKMQRMSVIVNFSLVTLIVHLLLLLLKFWFIYSEHRCISLLCSCFFLNCQEALCLLFFSARYAHFLFVAEVFALFCCRHVKLAALPLCPFEI